MPKPDSWVAGCLLLLGLGAVAGAVRLRVGELASPGPGFFPFWLGILLCMASLALLAGSLGRGGGRTPGKYVAAATPSGTRKVVGTLLGLAGYAIAFEPLGFAPATFLFLLFLYRVVEPRRWRAAIAGSLIITVISYTLFQLLRVPLPSGAWLP